MGKQSLASVVSSSSIESSSLGPQLLFSGRATTAIAMVTPTRPALRIVVITHANRANLNDRSVVTCGRDFPLSALASFSTCTGCYTPAATRIAVVAFAIQSRARTVSEHSHLIFRDSIVSSSEPANSLCPSDL